MPHNREQKRAASLALYNDRRKRSACTKCGMPAGRFVVCTFCRDEHNRMRRERKSKPRSSKAFRERIKHMTKRIFNPNRPALNAADRAAKAADKNRRIAVGKRAFRKFLNGKK